MIDGNGIPLAEIMTAEQLERIDIPGKSTELVRGRLVVSEPPGTFHGKLAGRLLLRVVRCKQDWSRPRLEHRTRSTVPDCPGKRAGSQSARRYRMAHRWARGWSPV